MRLAVEAGMKGVEEGVSKALRDGVIWSSMAREMRRKSGAC